MDYEDFVKADYFRNGHVYIDEDKETYKALKFTSMGLLSGYGMLNPSVYTKASEAKKRGIVGNLQGDGFQLGGLLIIDKNGDVVFSHVQKSYTDQPNVDDLLKSVEQYNKKI